MKRLIDAISLRERIDRCYPFDKATQSKHDAFDIAKSVLLDIVMTQPTIKPEPEWIPCSKKMPEEHEWLGTKKFGTTISNEVYVTFEVPDGQRFTKHISFQNGKLSPADEERMKIWFKGAKPIAWKPLPEPYREEGKGCD